jgi:pimeloyl-ACP methyl ester carboxylesterase
MTATDASLLDLPSAESTRHTVNGVDLHVVTAGDPSNPMVVLLHGFPDFWYGWRHQVPALVDAGYRVLVPDQRGYNLSDRPEGLDSYRMGRLSADAAALIESEGRDSAHVVGHDWGAAVAWDLALRHPEYVDRLGIVNVPHPVVLRKTLLTNPRQLLRSWYVFAFQLPRLPEWYLGRDGAAGMIRALEMSSRSEAFTRAELDHYRAAWQRAGTVRASIDWYRAVYRRPDMAPRKTVEAPTVVVWGEEDDALVSEMARKSLDYCADGKLVRFPHNSHWVHMERPDTVNEHLLDHLAG